MGTAWALLLFLALLPDPGVSQIGAGIKRCQDCQTWLNEENRTLFQRAIDGRVDKYVKCPHSEYIKYILNDKTVICANRRLSWVKELMECLDGDKKCLTAGSSDSRKEFSKGTNEKSSTTTTKVPTTAMVSSMEPSTMSWDPNTGLSTDPAKHGAATPTASLVNPSNSSTKPPEHVENSNRHQGNKLPETSDEESKRKMKQMTTAIIVLILIVLILTAVGVGLYCHKKKNNHLNAPCGSRSIKYAAAPSKDSVTSENSEIPLASQNEKQM